MNCRNYTVLLGRFVEYLDELGTEAKELTVADLRVQIRFERLTEFSEWSYADLDVIEYGLSTFDHGNLVRDLPEPQFANSSTFNSPSPFAWV